MKSDEERRAESWERMKERLGEGPVSSPSNDSLLADLAFKPGTGDYSPRTSLPKVEWFAVDEGSGDTSVWFVHWGGKIYTSDDKSIEARLARTRVRWRGRLERLKGAWEVLRNRADAVPWDEC